MSVPESAQILFLLGTDMEEFQDQTESNGDGKPEPVDDVISTRFTRLAEDLDWAGKSELTMQSPAGGGTALLPVVIGLGTKPVLAEIKSVGAVGGAMSAEMLVRVIKPEPKQDEPPRPKTAGGPAEPARMAVHERIQGRSRIQEIADALSRNRSEGLLRSKHAAPVPLRALEYVKDSEIIRWAIFGAVPPTPFVVEVTGYNSMYHLPIDSAQVRGTELHTPLPAEIVRVRRRWRRRAVTRSDHVIEFQHPVWPELRVRRPLRDISHGGLAFWSVVNQDLLYVGLRIPEVTILGGGGDEVRVAAEVRFVNYNGAPSDSLCGLQITPRSQDERRAWESLVTRILYPRTDIGSRWSEATWDLYWRSGYFDLSGKQGNYFDPLKPAFVRINQCFDASPHVGVHVVWPLTEKKLQAAFSMLKTHTGTWFSYQLAKITGSTPDGVSGREVLRDIHLRAFEHVQYDPNLRWIYSYPQVKRIWSRAVHFKLPHRYSFSGLAAVVRVRAVEVLTEEHAQSRGVAKVSEATSSEIEQLLAQLAVSRARPYVESLDLVPDRVSMSQIIGTWRAVGLERDRTILAARVGGKMVAAAVAELAEEGIHLYRLLDVIRMYPTVEGGEVYFPALLEACRSWYRHAGRKRVVWFVEDELSHAKVPENEGLVDMGLADLCILSAELFPEMLEHLSEVTSPRAPGPGRKSS